MRSKWSRRGNGGCQHTNKNQPNRTALHVAACLPGAPEGDFPLPPPPSLLAEISTTKRLASLKWNKKKQSSINLSTLQRGGRGGTRINGGVPMFSSHLGKDQRAAASSSGRRSPGPERREGLERGGIQSSVVKRTDEQTPSLPLPSPAPGGAALALSSGGASCAGPGGPSGRSSGCRPRT